MNKKRVVTLVVGILALLLIGLCAIMPVLRLHLRTNIYMFGDLSECDSLETLNVADGHFTKYQDTKLDHKLDNLQYTDFFAGKYTCDQYSFEIFAYVFDDPTSAKTYFENATGKNSNEVDANFSMVSGAVTSHIIVFKGCMAYAVYCPSADLQDVSMILADCFQVMLK